MDFKERTKLKIAISKIEEEEKAMSKNNNLKIKKGIGIAACFVILFSSIVYAKDIENYFKKIFNNSTEAIDKAVENGYVQQENMEYTYDKNIGIKVDNLVLDDLNLDISFNFETEKENVKSIRLKDFNITNDNNKVVFRSEFKSSETIDELPIYNSVNWGNEPIKLADTTFLDSILFGLKPEREDFKELYFDVKSLQLTYMDDSREIVDGNWKFDVAINDEMRKNNKNITYILLEENEYVKSATAILSPTGMFIDLKLKEPVDYDNMFEKARLGEISNDEMYNFILKCNNKAFMPGLKTGGIEKNSDGVIDATVEYENISSLNEKFDEFEIYIVSFNTTIKFIKDKN